MMLMGLGEKVISRYDTGTWGQLRGLESVTLTDRQWYAWTNRGPEPRYFGRLRAPR